ncbi:MAG TPA: histidine kinase dimerization/phosphoacceptor domain -containing protein [Reyranella sp.]|nr:histidine kinase dimerization/phosphoacceptor domain -containing protein [Reyranella sp.]
MIDPDPFNDFADGRALARAIVDTIREPLLVLDKDLRVVAASRSFFLTFKMNRQDVQGRPIYALGDGQWDIPQLRLLLERILPQQAVMDGYEVEQEFSLIGRRTMVLNARTVFYEKHDQALILLAIEDITERRTAERGLAELMQQKETLLQEMQHRVANSLQIIASILLLKARTVRSDETRLHLQDAHRRVMSVAAVQQQLQATRHGEHFPIAPYLSRLCDTLAASMIGEDRPIKVEVRAGPGDVSSNEAVSIGLIVTELLINALKHAFADASAVGLIVVSYEVAETAWRLAVCDNGVGKPDGAIARTPPGLGTSIVEALSRQLEADVTVSRTVPHGMTVTIAHGAFPTRLPEAA